VQGLAVVKLEACKLKLKLGSELGSESLFVRILRLFSGRVKALFRVRLMS
jgi:hypothetical protein